MAWSDWSNWDTAGQIGGTLGAALESAGDSLLSTARTLEQQASTSTGRAELMRNIWQQLDTLTSSAIQDLDSISPSKLTTEIVGSVNTMRLELAKAEAFLQSANTTALVAKNVDALGKNLGAIVGAAELLYKLNNPNLTNYDFGETGASFIGGVIGASIGVLIPLPGATVVGGIAGGVVASLLTKYMWENHVAPLMGWSEKSSPNFWDSIFDAMGLRPPTAIISSPLGTTPDPLIKVVRYVDPLILDLDGDGLEITPLSKGIVFDANGDTIKTGTAWAGADDGMLVWDRNGNGAIDSGQELFGDETILANGQKASHGFAALADLDTGSVVNNATVGAADGVFDAQDAQYTNLRIWRDLNQDGISQANELKTLSETGISSIKLSSSTVDANYVDAILAQGGTFTRDDGSTGQAGSFILAQNNFLREFIPITVSDAAKALPNFEGSGWVRDLQEAATQSPELVDLFNQVKEAPTRAEFKSAIADLLLQWGNDSAYDNASKQALRAGYGLTLSDPIDEQEVGWMDLAVKASATERNAFRATLNETDLTKFDAMRERMVGRLEKVYAYEAFTGHTFLNYSQIYSDATYDPSSGPSRWVLVPGSGGGGGRPVETWVPLSTIIAQNPNGYHSSQPGYIRVNIPTPEFGTAHVDTLWNRLVDDATFNLTPSLHLSKYLNLIDINLDATGISWGFSRFDAAISSATAANTLEGSGLLIDLYRTYGKFLENLGWNGTDQLVSLVNLAESNADVRSAFIETRYTYLMPGTPVGTDFKDVYSGNSSDNTFAAGMGDDIVSGQSGNDYLIGGVGSDLLDGGADADTIEGGDGNDTIRGGTGNDLLYGNAGDDLVLGGEGNDSIYDYDAGCDLIDGGDGDDLILESGVGIKKLQGGAGNDTITYGAKSQQNTIDGGAGNDTIATDGFGTIFVKDSPTQVNTITGGQGNDSIRSGRAADTYVFNRGDGSDAIDDRGASLNGVASGTDAIVFGPGISIADLTFRRVGDHMAIEVAGANGAPNDSITVLNWFLPASGGQIEQIKFDDGTSLSAAQVTALSAVIKGTGGVDNLSGDSGDNMIFGYAGNDTIYEWDGGNDQIDGGDDNDYILDTGAGVNTLLGGAGNDKIVYGPTSSQNTVNGGSGNDTISYYTNYASSPTQVNTIIGGLGNDSIASGRAADTYVFNRGDGQDLIEDYGYTSGGITPGQDTILFGAGITASDLTFRRAGDDMVIELAGSNGEPADSITVRAWFFSSGTGYQIEQIRFDDGTSLSATEVTALSLAIKGTTGADSLSGNSGDNMIFGYAGNDTIYEWDGGSDLIDGGDDNDYILDTGAGVNTLLGGAGNDKIVYGPTSSQNTLNGGSGNDTISYYTNYASSPTQVNTIIGGQGDDSISSGRAADTYVFNRGDGQDLIEDYGYTSGSVTPGQDTIAFGPGISVSDLTFRRAGDNMIIEVAGIDGASSDSLTLRYWFFGSGYQIEHIQFADGTTLSNTQVSSLFQSQLLLGDSGSNSLTGADSVDAIYGQSGQDSLTGNGDSDLLFGGVDDDSLSGGIGSDVLAGESGADILDGGDDDDFLYGGDGNDTLKGGNGNDLLNGGKGSDTYLFQPGQGQDVIVSSAASALEDQDVIEFGVGVKARDIQVQSVGADLILTIKGTSDSVTIKGFDAAHPKVALAKFGDGTIVSMLDLVAGRLPNKTPTGDVLVTGASMEGQTLFASNTLADGDGLGSISYEWLRNGTATGNTGASYLLTQADVGATIAVTASYTDGQGTAETISSSPTDIVLNVNDAPTGIVDIAGTAEQGQTLTVSNTLADVDGLGAITYQWLRDGNATGSTGDSYVLTQADVGAKLSVSASYTDAQGTAETVASAQTSAVANVNDAPTGSVNIAGTVEQGQTLTASNTLADVDGLGAITYQWLRDGNATGSTGDSYVLTQADVGAKISVSTSYTDGQGTAESVVSTQTTSALNVNDGPTGIVSIAGTAEQGQTLTVSNTLADVDGLGAITYQWLRDGSATGSTGGSYVLTQADVGAKISVSASYTDGQGTAESVVSTQTTSVLNVNDGPTGIVSIAGTAEQGQTLTVSNTLADVDGLGAITYQWLRDGNATGSTGNSYVLTQADVGAKISVSASYTDGQGTAEAVNSAQTGAVVNVDDAPTGIVSISGTATQGQTLTASNTLADVDGLGAITYQWLRNGNATGSTGGSYVLTQADVDAKISVSASYTDGQGTAEAVTSAQTDSVLNVNDAPTGTVSISGTATQGQTLTASNTLADVDGLGAITYQWLRNGNATGSTGSSYTLTQADVGANISVSASYTDGQGAAEVVSSVQTGAVANINDAPTGGISISGTATQGQTLTASNTLADVDGLGAITYQWLRNGNTTGSTGSSYTLTQADVGAKISVTASYTDGQGTAEAVTSVQTSSVLSINQTLSGTTGNDVLTGGVGDDTLQGIAGNDTLNGDAGNDSLDGGLGTDRMVGGTGNDTYVVDASTDLVVENANEGVDTIQSSITFSIASLTNVEYLTLTGNSTINGTGNGLDNLLTGNGAANTLTGGAGNDTLVGGAGNDAMVGGTGNDTYVVDVSGDTITENANEGTDTVQSVITFSIATLANVENITLTGNTAINATGNAAANVLTGNGMANTLSGGTGIDTLIGGAGNDIYVVDNISDVVTEYANEGIDLIQSSVTYTLSNAYVENLTLTGTNAINGTGNALDNLLTGNSAINTLTGGAGNDTLDGAGNADSLMGGIGDDVYVVDNTGDKVVENANEGLDTVKSSVTWTLATLTNIENLTLTGTNAINGTGNGLDNWMIGNGAVNSLTGGVGNDTLDGGVGADVLIGGLGNDLYIVDNTTEKLTENANEGTDTVQSTVTWTLAANFENLTLGGSNVINGTGNTAANVLTGNSATNTLTGGGGNDSYRGGLGADTLSATSTTSNDTYIWGRGEGADVLTDSGGTDQLQILAGVTADQVWLRHVGNNLEVSVIGTTDSFTVNSWYSSTANQVETFKLADGKTLTAANAQKLVDAMASFSPPAQGQTTLPANYQTSLNPVIAANWV